MPVVIVDIRPTRRGKILEVAQRIAGDAAHSVPHLDAVDAPDVILLHIGLEQETRKPGEVTEILRAHQERAWILCYRGGQNRVAFECASPNVAVFPAPVDALEPEIEFLRTVEQVLAKWADRETLPAGWFYDTVTGFDPVLEAKLDVLSAALTEGTVSADRVRPLRSLYPSAFSSSQFQTTFDESGNLQLDRDGLFESVAHLRRVFFHEEVGQLAAKSQGYAEDGGGS